MPTFWKTEKRCMSNSLLTVGSCWASFLWGPCQLPSNLSQTHGVTLASGSLLSGAVLPMLWAPRQLVVGASVQGRAGVMVASALALSSQWIPLLSMRCFIQQQRIQERAFSVSSFLLQINRWITDNCQQSRRNGFRLPRNLSPTTES